MERLKPKGSDKILIGVTAAYLLSILFFGLRPQSFSFSNDVRWLLDTDGIRIGKYGLVINEDLKGLDLEGPVDDFSIVFAVRALSGPQSGFKTLLMLHNGSDNAQLIVSQWKTSIIVMNGDDYDNSKKSKKFILKDALIPGEAHFFVVAAGRSDGVTFYVDGTKVSRQADISFRIPPASGRLKLVVGNSIYGNQSWSGEIFGLSLYGDLISDEAILSLYRQWQEAGHFGFDRNYKPVFSYSFDERSGNRVEDKTGAKNSMIIPAWKIAPEKQFFSMPWAHFRANKHAFIDIILNILGFLPLGLLTFMGLKRGYGRKDKACAVIAIGVCFLVSLFIETGQAWMPSRYSNLLDLILNTLGGAAGVLAGYKMGNR